jgi:hypothetical protein
MDWKAGGRTDIMTETEWLACTDPRPMLEFLRGRTSDRKLRLFAVGCCRRVWHLFTEQDSRRAVEVAEAYADGRANNGEREKALWSFYFAARKRANYIAAKTTNWSAAPKREGFHYAAAAALAEDGYWVWDKLPDSERMIVSGALGLLHCIFGNPFRPIAFNPACRTGSVLGVAQTIYDDRRFEDLPILADPLEEAGCQDADILGHCRGPGPHTRGCWVVDLLLGKE